MTAAERVPQLVVPVGTRENVRAKSLRLLLSGAVHIDHKDDDLTVARVIGDSAEHEVRRTRWGWHCDCAAARGTCSHVAAVRFVTNRRRTSR